MYPVAIDRIPLLTFSAYVKFSCFCLIFSIIHCYVYLDLSNVSSNSSNSTCGASAGYEPLYSSLGHYLTNSWCFWSVLNMLYCLLLYGCVRLHSVFFGKLQKQEQHYIREQFWNVIFYRVIFLYGVVNIQSPLEGTLWAAWSALIAVLYILAYICKGRAQMDLNESISCYRPKLLFALLILVNMVNLCLSLIAIAVGLFISIRIMLFMLAEVLQVFIVAVFAIILILNSIRRDNNKQEDLHDDRHKEEAEDWDENVPVADSELIFQFLLHLVDLLHYIHMLPWSNMRLNVATLVLLLHIHYLYNQIYSQYKQFVQYRKTLRFIQAFCAKKRLPLSSSSHELHPTCCICWDSMQQAVALPCEHQFHAACLMKWLPVNGICPMCRLDIWLFAITVEDQKTPPHHNEMPIVSEHLNIHNRFAPPTSLHSL